MFRAPSAPILGVACGAHSFKNIRRVMWIPNVFIFEIGQWESGFYSELTDTQNHRIIQYRIII